MHASEVPMIRIQMQEKCAVVLIILDKFEILSDPVVFPAIAGLDRCFRFELDVDMLVNGSVDHDYRMRKMCERVW